MTCTRKIVLNALSNINCTVFVIPPQCTGKDGCETYFAVVYISTEDISVNGDARGLSWESAVHGYPLVSPSICGCRHTMVTSKCIYDNDHVDDNSLCEVRRAHKSKMC